MKNHLHYEGWKYLAGFFVILLGWWLVFTVTETRLGTYQTVDVAFMGLLEDDRPLVRQIDELQQQGFVDAEAVNVANIQYVGTEAEDHGDNSGEYRLVLTVASQEMDIYILPRGFYNSLASQGAFLPLDGYLQDGTLSLPDMNLEPMRQMAMEGLSEEFAGNIYQKMVYGVPADMLTDLYKVGYDPSGCVVAVTAFSENREDSLKLVQWMFDNFRGQHPDMLKAIE